MARARSKPKTETIDFSGVSKERGGGRRHIEEGDYLAKIISCEKRWKNNDRSNPPFYSWRIQITDGKYKGTTFYHTTTLMPEHLFGLRNLILAATGRNVAGKSLRFDPMKLYGKVIAISVEDDTYTKSDNQGNEREVLVSRIVDTRPKDELDLDADEEDEEVEEDEDEEEEEEEEEDEEEEELEDVDLEEL